MMSYIYDQNFRQAISRIKNYTDNCNFENEGLLNARENFVTFSTKNWQNKNNSEIAREIAMFMGNAHPEVAWQVIVAT